MRLKPMLTSRISLVMVVSSSRESYSPSRMRPAASASSRSGWLMRRAIRAEPTTVASSAMTTHHQLLASEMDSGVGLVRSQKASSPTT